MHTFVNRLKHRAMVAGVVALAAFGSGHQAYAATATSSIAVTAAILQTCIVSASALAFGTYDPTSATPSDSSTALTVTCSLATTYNVGLSAGGGSGASVATRKMTSGGNTLDYSLYTSAARSTVWGNTVGVDTVSGTGTGLPVAYTVYGRVAAQQSVPAGAYTDTVTVTVTY